MSTQLGPRSLVMGQKIHHCNVFLLSSLYSFDSIFLFWLCYSGIAWIDKLHNCVQGNSLHGLPRNRHFLTFHAPSITLFWQILTTAEKIELTGRGIKCEKMLQPQKVCCPPFFKFLSPLLSFLFHPFLSCFKQFPRLSRRQHPSCPPALRSKPIFKRPLKCWKKWLGFYF